MAGAAAARLRLASRSAMRGASGSTRPSRASAPINVGVQQTRPSSPRIRPVRITAGDVRLAPNAASAAPPTTSVNPRVRARARGGEGTSPGEPGDDVLPGRRPGRRERGQHPGQHRDPAEHDEGRGPAAVPTEAGAEDVLLHEWTTGERRADTEQQPRRGAQHAQHHPVGEHDPTQLGRVPTGHRDQRQSRRRRRTPRRTPARPAVRPPAAPGRRSARRCSGRWCRRSRSSSGATSPRPAGGGTRPPPRGH